MRPAGCDCCSDVAACRADRASGAAVLGRRCRLFFLHWPPRPLLSPLRLIAVRCRCRCHCPLHQQEPTPPRALQSAFGNTAAVHHSTAAAAATANPASGTSTAPLPAATVRQGRPAAAAASTSSSSSSQSSLSLKRPRSPLTVSLVHSASRAAAAFVPTSVSAHKRRSDSSSVAVGLAVCPRCAVTAHEQCSKQRSTADWSGQSEEASILHQHAARPAHRAQGRAGTAARGRERQRRGTTTAAAAAVERHSRQGVAVEAVCFVAGLRARVERDTHAA